MKFQTISHNEIFEQPREGGMRALSAYRHPAAHPGAAPKSLGETDRARVPQMTIVARPGEFARAHTAQVPCVTMKPTEVPDSINTLKGDG